MLTTYVLSTRLLHPLRLYAFDNEGYNSIAQFKQKNENNIVF